MTKIFLYIVSIDKNPGVSCERPRFKLVLGIRTIFGLLVLIEWVFVPQLHLISLGLYKTLFLSHKHRYPGWEGIGSVNPVRDGTICNIFGSSKILPYAI